MRITLICAALLTICCILLTISNNLSAALMADQISAVSVLPARDTIPGTPVPETDWVPVTDTTPALQQAQKVFHTRSLLVMRCV